jgi:hypothetical protein
MFIGVCGGSGKLPYEVSCDYCKDCIESAKTGIKNCESQIAKLKALPIDNHVGQIYVYSKEKGKSIPIREADLFWDPEGGRFKLGAIMVRKDDRIFIYNEHIIGDPEKAMHEIAKKCRAMEIGIVVQRIAGLEDYIKWQQARVDNWKPQELVPIVRDPLLQSLSTLEIKLLKDIFVVCQKKETKDYTISDRSSYMYKQTVTYNRVKWLAEMGYVTITDQGHNRDGNFVTVQMTDKGTTEASK